MCYNNLYHGVVEFSNLIDHNVVSNLTLRICHFDSNNVLYGGCSVRQSKANKTYHRVSI